MKEGEMDMIWIVLGIVAVLAVWYISTYNGFVSLNVKCEEAYSTMDIYLKKGRMLS